MKEIPWKDSTSSLFTQIAWHKDKWMTPPLEAFINLTRKIFLSDDYFNQKGFFLVTATFFTTFWGVSFGNYIINFTHQ